MLRGALPFVLSEDRVRTRHMEAMLDAAMRKVMAEGAGEEAHGRDPCGSRETRGAGGVGGRQVAAAIAAADQRVVPEEHAFLASLARGLGIDEARAENVLKRMAKKAVAK